MTHEARETHTGAGFLAFLKRLARANPKGEVHLILDNVATHKTPAVTTWLCRHKRFAFHSMPTGASWPIQIETWFSIRTRQAIRRGSFGCVEDLITAINELANAGDDHAAPFAWVKTADRILAKAVKDPRSSSGAVSLQRMAYGPAR